MNCCGRFAISRGQFIGVCFAIDLLARRGREQGTESPAFGAIERRENLGVDSTYRGRHVHFVVCEMQQDCNLGLDLLAAAPTGAIYPQEVRTILAAFHLVGVVQAAMMEAAAPDVPEVILGQHLLEERAGAKGRIRDGEHFGSGKGKSLRRKMRDAAWQRNVNCSSPAATTARNVAHSLDPVDFVSGSRLRTNHAGVTCRLHATTLPGMLSPAQRSTL